MMIDLKERNRRDALTFGEQMREAEAACVPCALCGGAARITDAGPGHGYYIECTGSHGRKPSCTQSGVRLSGWAYNVSDLWNRLNATQETTP